MSNNPVAVTVNILDREYQVACKAGEEDGLRSSARYLDGKMREIRDRGNVIGIDRIAVMAALNIAHECLELKPLQEEQNSLAQRIITLQQQISQAVLSEDPQPELI